MSSYDGPVSDVFLHAPHPAWRVHSLMVVNDYKILYFWGLSGLLITDVDLVSQLSVFLCIWMITFPCTVYAIYDLSFLIMGGLNSGSFLSDVGTMLI